MSETQAFLDRAINDSKITQGRQRLERLSTHTARKPCKADDALKVLDEKYPRISNRRPIASSDIRHDFWEKADLMPNHLPVREWRETLMCQVAALDGLDAEPAIFLIDHIHNLRHPQTGMLYSGGFMADINRITRRLHHLNEPMDYHVVSLRVANWSGLLRDIGTTATEHVMDAAARMFHDLVRHTTPEAAEFCEVYNDNGILRAIICGIEHEQAQAIISHYQNMIQQLNSYPVNEFCDASHMWKEDDRTLGDIPNRNGQHRGLAVVNAACYTVNRTLDTEQNLQAIRESCGMIATKQTRLSI